VAELRAELAAYLGRARGVRADPDGTVACSGFTQGLGLLARVLHRQGRHRIGVEAYGHRLHRDVLTDAGLVLTALPVDDQGAETGRPKGWTRSCSPPPTSFPSDHL
jgi:GntR family transcriptional regulator/MocR family aminotransferase